MRGRTIRIYLVDGAPTGILTAEIINWTGKVIVAPRSQLVELAKMEEAKRTGVYCLIGPDPESLGKDRVYVGEGDNVLSRLTSHGNGSIMRLAPVPIRYCDMFPNEIGHLAERAIESSLPTHASPQCLSACVYMTVVLRGLIDGRPREEVLGPGWEPMRRASEIAPFHPEVAEVAEGSFRRKQPPEIVGSGYVVKSLEAALWAFHNAKDFREAVLRAINLGDDTDTTGAICGQLAGAYWAERGIPGEWLEGLARRDMIEKALQGMLGSRGTIEGSKR